MAKEKNQTVRVRLVKSPNSCQGRHRLSVKALGLRKLNSSAMLEDTPAVRGMIHKIAYLVKYEG